MISVLDCSKTSDIFVFYAIFAKCKSDLHIINNAITPCILI